VTHVDEAGDPLPSSFAQREDTVDAGLFVSTGLDEPIVEQPSRRSYLPAEYAFVEFYRAIGIVGGDVEVNDPTHVLLSVTDH
jgi:hypothetical protein